MKEKLRFLGLDVHAETIAVARHRLSKFLLRSGQRPPTGVKPWTRPYLIWVAQLRFTQIAQRSTRQDSLHEVEHMRGRVEEAISRR